jgi:branched-chain amino acid aminotransferase
LQGGQLEPIELLVEARFHRAAPGGMGGTKAAGNYSPVLLTQLAAKQAGFADVIYLDAKSDTFLEEVRPGGGSPGGAPRMRVRLVSPRPALPCLPPLHDEVILSLLSACTLCDEVSFVALSVLSTFL